MATAEVLNKQNPLDYLKIGQFGNETVKLSTKIFKLNRKNKKQERIFLLTNSAIYNIKPGKNTITEIRNRNNNISPQRRIDLISILSITLSILSNEFTLNIPSEYDYRYEAFTLSDRKEVINAISQTRKQIQNIPLSIHKINDFSTAQFTVSKRDSKKIRLKKLKDTKKQPTIRLSTTDISRMPYLISNDQNTLLSPKYKPRHSAWVLGMDATEYYQHLIHGYIHIYTPNSMHSNLSNDIKSLIISFYYKFLKYNEYCDVKVQQRMTTKLLVFTKLTEILEMTQNDLQFGGRMVSRIPINGCGKVSVKIMDTFRNLSVSKNTEFETVAINGYYASVVDELDLIEGNEYTVMQTSPNGWWYAVNEDGESGWVPSSYLKRLYDGNGLCAIGLTTHPNEFMNVSITEQPFNGCNVKHSVFWVQSQITTVVDGNIMNDTVDGCVGKGDVVDIYIENDEYIKFDKNSKNRISIPVHNRIRIPEYYFALVFTVTTKKIIKYQISGKLV